MISHVYTAMKNNQVTVPLLCLYGIQFIGTEKANTQNNQHNTDEGKFQLI